MKRKPYRRRRANRRLSQVQGLTLLHKIGQQLDRKWGAFPPETVVVYQPKRFNLDYTRVFR